MLSGGTQQYVVELCRRDATIVQTANQGGNLKKILAFLDGLFGRAANAYGLWPLAPAGFVTTITVLLGSTTQYIVSLGPFAWWVISLIAGFITYVTIVAGGWAMEATRERRVKREIAEKLASVSALNPLEDRFFKKRLSLNDFADPFGLPLQKKVFEQCELIGPAIIVIIGCDYARNAHLNVEFAKIDDNKLKALPNKVILQGGAIRDCRIANVLFLVPNSGAAAFDTGFDNQLPWIN